MNSFECLIIVYNRKYINMGQINQGLPDMTHSYY